MNIHSKIYSLFMKTIFITGAASGLGKATALLFAQRGWRVLATMRTLEADAELAAFPTVTQLALDVTNPGEIKQVVVQVTAEQGVDVVFNNAGYILAGPLEGASDQQLLNQLATNFLGPVRITQAFLPHFRQQGSGLFLNTTSMSALIPDPFLAIYGALKAGLEQWSFAMKYELSKFNLRMKTVVPGVVKTGIARSADIAHSDPYAPYFDRVLGFLSSPEHLTSGSTAEQVAEVVYEAATDGKDQVRYLAGADAQARAGQLQELGIEAIQQAVDHLFFGQK